MLLSARSQTADPPTASLRQENPSDMSEGLTSFLGGVSGLLFAISLIFFLQAPLISGGILLTLISGWGGKAIYQSRKTS